MPHFLCMIDNTQLLESAPTKSILENMRVHISVHYARAFPIEEYIMYPNGVGWHRIQNESCCIVPSSDWWVPNANIIANSGVPFQVRLLPNRNCSIAIIVKTAHWTRTRKKLNGIASIARWVLQIHLLRRHLAVIILVECSTLTHEVIYFPGWRDIFWRQIKPSI